MSNWTGDWMCNSCQHMNFKKRDTCHRCGVSIYGGAVADMSTNYGGGYSKNNEVIMPGDWYCQAMNCGAHNYASRTTCYRCGTVKLDYAAGYEGNIISGGLGCDSLLPGWKTGDWLCTRPGCGVHNYASRMECYKCKAPRDYDGAYIGN